MTGWQKKIVLLDGNGMAYRAFYALPPLETSRGEKVQAVYGFMTMLIKILDEINPDFIAAAFDKAPPSERLKEYQQYKAHRQKMPESLSSQLLLIEKILSIYRIPIFWEEGYEADDCIGTMATKAQALGIFVIIFSGDLDFLQLISPNVKVVTPKRGISDMIEYDEEQVRKKFGLSPAQIVDMKALAGDSSDNIPGVPGIGEVSAQKLIREFGSLEGVIENLELVQPKWRNLIRSSIESAKLGKKLVTIRTDIDIPFDINRCVRTTPDPVELKEFLTNLQFVTLLKKYFPSEEKRKTPSVDFSLIDRKENWEKAKECFKKAEQLAVFRIGKGSIPFHSRSIGIAIATGSSEIFYISFQLDISKEHNCCADIQESLSEKFIVSELGKLLESRELWGYDIKELLHLFIYYTSSHPEKFFDVGIASHLLNPQETSPELSSIVMKYLEKEIGKREELFKKSKAEECSPVCNEEVAKYATSSAAVIIELVPILREKLRRSELEKVYYELELPLIPVLVHMEREGIFADVFALKDASLKLGERIRILEERVYKLAGEKFNINSPKQLGEILFVKLGFPAPKKTKLGYSTSQEVLHDLEEFPIVRQILEYKEAKKLQSTYADALPGMINFHTHRIHTTFNSRGTATGRLSSSEPNLQNIPIRSVSGQVIRRAFRPQDEGDCFIEADYSQIELRVLAHLSRDERLIKAFQNDEDVHNMTASEIFGIELSSVDVSLRRKAKEINFGIIYGMSAHGLAQRTGVSRHEAKEYIERYMERFEGVKKFIELTIAEAHEHGFVTTILGRKRWLPDLKSRNMNIRKASERMAINTPVQGSAAEIIKCAMIAIQEEITKNLLPARMILQVHDELLFEVKEDKSEDVCAVIKKIMEGIFPLIVPLKVYLKKGKSWALMTELNGMAQNGEVVGASKNFN